MLYNGVELPELPEYDESIYGNVLIIRQNTDSSYVLYIAPNVMSVDDNEITIKKSSVGYVVKYFVDPTIGRWAENSSYSLLNIDLKSQTVIWCLNDIFNSDGSVYLAGSDSIAPSTLTIESSQIFDDSASFVVYISDVDFTAAEYTLKYVLTSNGEEIKSNVSEVITEGTEGFHLTSPNLTPETDYEITFTLQKDGVDTPVTASTTFTTLAGSAAGEGETPDYSGQLGEIQQGIGDIQTSVDGVGETLEGVQDTLTETKEEITSLPQKIATAISDGVKGLFIPSQEDLTAIRDKYEDMLSEKLGFVWQAFDLLTNVVSGLHESLESGEPYEFTFPGIKLPMQGEEFVLVSETSVSLENNFMDVVRPVCGTIVGTVAVIDLFNLCHDLVMAIISGISAYEFENGRKREK